MALSIWEKNNFQKFLKSISVNINLYCLFQCWWLPCSLLSCWCSIFSVKNNPPAEPCNYVWLRYQYVFSVSAILSLYWKLFTNKLILLSREFIVNYCEIYQILCVGGYIREYIKTFWKTKQCFLYLSTLFYNSQQLFLYVTVTYLGNINSLWPLYTSISNLTFHINLSHVTRTICISLFPWDWQRTTFSQNGNEKSKL